MDEHSELGQWLAWADHYVDVSDPLRRFTERAGRITLYFSGPEYEIRRINAVGFVDPPLTEYGPEHAPTGVTVSDERVDRGWPDAHIALEVPNREVLPHETTRPGYRPRTFCVPACVLNRLLKLARPFTSRGCASGRFFAYCETI